MIRRAARTSCLVAGTVVGGTAMGSTGKGRSTTRESWTGSRARATIWET